MATKKTPPKVAPSKSAPPETKVVRKSLQKSENRDWMTPEQRAQYEDAAIETTNEEAKGAGDAEQ